MKFSCTNENRGWPAGVFFRGADGSRKLLILMSGGYHLIKVEVAGPRLKVLTTRQSPSAYPCSRLSCNPDSNLFRMPINFTSLFGSPLNILAL